MHSRLKFDIGWGPLLWTALGAPVSQARHDAAQQDLENFWPDRHIVIGLSERTLFDALLSELALPRGDSVLMSGINIRNMADIVSAHGLNIAAADIDPVTLAPPPGALLEAQARTNARLCLVAQLYGSVNRIADAPSLRERGVLIVEDAAQGFAGPSYLGDPEADVSLFSFGPIKRRTALGGGIAAFRDAALASRVKQRLAAHTPRTETWLRQRALKYLLLKTLTGPALYSAVISAIKLTGKDPDSLIGEAARGFSGSNLIDAIRGRPPRRMIALMARQVCSTCAQSERQSTCRDFLRALPEAMTSLGKAAQQHAFWLVPLRCADPASAIRYLRQRGFDATRGTTSLRALDPASASNADTLMKEVVYIPHPAGLSQRQRKRLAKALTDCAAL